VVKLNFVVAYRLLACLADLPIAAHDLKHDLTGDVTARPAHFMSLRKRLGAEENRADMSKHRAGQFFRSKPFDPRVPRRVVDVQSLDGLQEFHVRAQLSRGDGQLNALVPASDSCDAVVFRGERKVFH
jgi:hypothetical protein